MKITSKDILEALISNTISIQEAKLIFTEEYGNEYGDTEPLRKGERDKFKRDEMEAELDHEDNPGYYMNNKSSDNKDSDYKEPASMHSGLNASQTNDFKNIISYYGNSMKIPEEYRHLITDYRNGKKFDAEQAKKLIKYMYSMELI